MCEPEPASGARRKTLTVTRLEKRAAELIMKIDAKLGDETDPAVRAIANARVLEEDPDPSRS